MEGGEMRGAKWCRGEESNANEHQWPLQIGIIMGHLFQDLLE